MTPIRKSLAQQKMATEPVKHTTAIRTARLFPLGEPLLFPGIVQPLHIFESRYCEMIENALDDNQEITMATLSPGYDGQEYFSRPPLEKHVCIGRITRHELTEAGTHNFLLAGVARGLILEELPPLRSYREAKVAIIDEIDDIPEDESEELRDSLLQKLAKRDDAARVIGESLESEQVPLPRILDALAVTLPLSFEDKLALAGEPSVRERLKLISSSLS